MPCTNSTGEGKDSKRCCNGAEAHIQKQNVRLLQEHAAERHPPPLSARERVHGRIACSQATPVSSRTLLPELCTHELLAPAARGLHQRLSFQPTSLLNHTSIILSTCTLSLCSLHWVCQKHASMAKEEVPIIELGFLTLQQTRRGNAASQCCAPDITGSGWVQV